MILKTVNSCNFLFKYVTLFALYPFFLQSLRLRFIKFLKKVAQFALALFQFYFLLA